MPISLARRPVAPVPMARPVQPDRLTAIQVAEAQRSGVVAAARIQSGAFATSVALHSATMLSRTTDVAFEMSCAGENVYRSIFNAFGSFATQEIERLSFHSGGR
jgi:hypothetical protein